ncbi:hypothetical protein KGQ71_00875 [Patescibacteria group bacterium]|nr:hypothetical protein [Patescibacteria group bacterium]
MVIFLIGSAALWSLAGLVKHQRFLEFPIGSFTDLGNQVRQATEQKANQAVHQAADTAQQQIKQAANQQITQQENQLKAQATQQIKQQAEQLAPTLIPAQK